MLTEPATIRIAVVRDLGGYLTVCGPNDFSPKEHCDQMTAAMGWHLEAGYLPAATYWVTAELPPVPSIPELRGQAEAGLFPKTFLEEIESEQAA